MYRTHRFARSTVFAAALAGAWLLCAAAAHALDFYVDAANGNDARGPLEAQSPATPWRTIDHALRHVGPGNTIRVRPGVYPESAGSAYDAVSLVADEGLGSVFLEPPAGASGIDVRHRDFVVDGIVVRGGATGLRAELADGLRVLRSAFVAQSGTGVRVVQSASVQIDSVVVASAGKVGIELERSAPSLVRNSLVYDTGTWGIAVEGEAAGTLVDTTLAFNTVAYNGGASGGGIFLRDVAADVHDNVLAFNVPIGLRVGAGAVPHVRHTLLFGSPQLVLPESSALGHAIVVADPLFTLPAGADGVLGGADGFLDDDFSLQQLAAGDPAQSSAVDAGSLAAGEIGGSTRRDGGADDGLADLGFHRDAPLADGVPADVPVTTPAPGSGAAYWVDCEAGDDGRSKLEAADPATPWRTMQRAARDLAYGEVAVVKPGTCAEQVETRAPGVAFVAATPGSVVVAPPPGLMGFNVQHDDVIIDGFVVRSAHQGILGAKSKAGTELRNLVLRNLVVEPPPSGVIATNGIQVRDARWVTVENSVVRGAAQQGIKLLRVNDAYVRNNLVVGQPNDWGISIDGDSPNRYEPTTGNVAAFNTVWGNLRGLRLRNSYGEIRDNIVAENTVVGIKYDREDAGWMVHHNDAYGSTTPYDLPSGVKVHASNLSVDPGFVAPEAGRFELRQAAGEEPASPLVDAGSGAVEEVDIDGSTRSDGAPDTGIADLGYHAGASASASAPGGPGPSLPPGPTPTPPPAPTPTPYHPPLPGSGATYWVDPVDGDDARGADEARSPESAWRSLTRAINAAAPGDTIVLRAGLYEAQTDVKQDSLTIEGEGPLGDVVISPPPGKAGVYVNGYANVRVRNLVVQGAAQGVVGREAPGLLVSGVAVVSSASNGIVVEDSPNAWIENSIVTGSGAMGIKLKQSGPAYVRNNLVYANADWAISLDDTTKQSPPPSSGNVVAFNTVHANRAGVRLLNTSGEVRDNSITSQRDVGLYLAAPDVTVHHNNFSANGRDRDQKDDFLPSLAFWQSLSVNPRYASPAGPDGVLGGDGWRDDDFRLQQLAAGDAQQSPLVDAGSGEVGALDIGGSTARDGAPDTGVADIGFHYDAPPGVEPPPAMPIGDNLQRTFHVSASLGDDARSIAAARRRETPWRTVARALRSAVPGDTIVVLPGTYDETVQVKVAGVTVLADSLGDVVLAPSSGNGVTVQAPDVIVDGFVIEGAATGISVLETAPRTRIRNCAVVGASTDGIRAVNLDEVAIESSIVTSSGGSGVRLKRVGGALVRNNLIYANGEWGVSLDASGAPAVSTGNLIAHNTLYANRVGNVALLNALGEVRDNLIAESPGRGLRLDLPGVLLLHNGFAGNGTAIHPSSYLFTCDGCAENRPLEPGFVAPAGADGVLGGAGWRDDDFRLRRAADGGVPSEAVDAGSTPAASSEVGGTTSTDGLPDEGIVDLGFHYADTERALPVPAPPAP